jgi:hypothetical protein
MKKFNNTLAGTDCGDAGLPAPIRDIAKAKRALRVVPNVPDELTAGRTTAPPLLTHTKIEPTLGKALMTKTLTALIAAASLASAISALPTTADARCPGCALGVGERPPEAPAGYVYYPAYAEPLPGPNCNWYRLPVYDASGNMVGWRGRPVAFCSWLAGYRPWPLP